MRWPAAQDYNEAVQITKLCFADQELRGGEVETNLFGLPQQRSGAFASVFKIHCPHQTYALRCFLRKMDGMQDRYEMISHHLTSYSANCLNEFSYLRQGIYVNGQWFPALKMPWQGGVHLDRWIRENLDKPAAIRDLAFEWIKVLTDLRQAGIAHGDLQHGNVLVEPTAHIHLVDYDGMFVPALHGQTSMEEGHRNYQHPGRNQATFGPHLDNFPGWLIFFSLLAISERPELWHKYGDGDDALLLKQKDLFNPGLTPVWEDLKQHDFLDKSIAAWLLEFLETPVENIPPVSEHISPDWQTNLPWWLEKEGTELFIPGIDDKPWQPNDYFVKQVTALHDRIATIPRPTGEMPDLALLVPPAVEPIPLPSDLLPIITVMRRSTNFVDEKKINWWFYFGLLMIGACPIFYLMHLGNFREEYVAGIIFFALGGLLLMFKGPFNKKRIKQVAEQPVEEQNPQYLYQADLRYKAENHASENLKLISASVGKHHEEFPSLFAAERARIVQRLREILDRLQTPPDIRAEKENKGEWQPRKTSRIYISNLATLSSQLHARGAVQKSLERKRSYLASVPDWEPDFRAQVDAMLAPEVSEMESPAPVKTEYDWHTDDNLLLGLARAESQKFDAWLERQNTATKWENARLLTAVWNAAQTKADLSVIAASSVNLAKKPWAFEGNNLWHHYRER